MPQRHRIAYTRRQVIVALFDRCRVVTPIDGEINSIGREEWCVDCYEKEGIGRPTKTGTVQIPCCIDENNTAGNDKQIVSGSIRYIDMVGLVWLEDRDFIVGIPRL